MLAAPPRLLLAFFVKGETCSGLPGWSKLGRFIASANHSFRYLFIQNANPNSNMKKHGLENSSSLNNMYINFTTKI